MRSDQRLEAAKEAWEPFAAIWAAMTRLGVGLRDERLFELAATESCFTQTNCGWGTYEAAQRLGPEFRRELERRAAQSCASFIARFGTGPWAARS